jgi:hypothetical protein
MTDAIETARYRALLRRRLRELTGRLDAVEREGDETSDGVLGAIVAG